MSICPSCNGRGSFIALVDGTRNGKRTGWRADVPCQDCKATGKVTVERLAEMNAEREARALARDERLKNRSQRDG